MDWEGKAEGCLCASIFLPGTQDASSKLEAEDETKLQTAVDKQGMRQGKCSHNLQWTQECGSDCLSHSETWDLLKRRGGSGRENS